MTYRAPARRVSGMTRWGRAWIAILTMGAGSCAVYAADAPSGSPSGSDAPVTAYGNVRYRIETVDQEGIARDAFASTLRARLGVRTREWQGFSAVLEGEASSRVGDERYNDTINGLTQYPVVADPKNVSVYQASLRWHWGDRFEVNAGRRAINLDNQRWVGSVDWRQNGQTLDGAGVEFKPLPGMTVSYNHVWRVNRIYGRDSMQGAYTGNRINLLRLSQEFKGAGSLVVYDYLLDIPDAPASSSRTLGARFSGAHGLGAGKLKLLYALEYARQSDYGRNPREFDLGYLLIEPGVAIGPLSIKAGYERLGGNGTVAVQTPLATLHAFNGWADKFLTTPATGLRDVYGDLTWKLGGPGLLKDTSLRAAWHDYRADHGSQRDGSEWDFMVSHPIGTHFTALVKYATYERDRFATDTDKFWTSIEAKF